LLVGWITLLVTLFTKEEGDIHVNFSLQKTAILIYNEAEERQTLFERWI
jgi:hypothetical protein